MNSIFSIIICVFAETVLSSNVLLIYRIIDDEENESG
jgi:hypothetical protein